MTGDKSKQKKNGNGKMVTLKLHFLKDSLDNNYEGICHTLHLPDGEFFAKAEGIDKKSMVC